MAENNKKKHYSQKSLGEQIFDIIQDSIDNMDFSGLNERIRETVEDTRDEISRQINNLQNGYYGGSSYDRDFYGNPFRKGRIRTGDGVYVEPGETGSGHGKRSGYKGAGAGSGYGGLGHGNGYGKAAGGRWQAGSRPGQTSGKTEPGESGQPRSLPGLYSGPIQMAAGGTGLAVFGGISLGLGLAALGAIGGAAAGGIAAAGVFTLLMTGVSGVLLGKGIISRNRANRLKEYIGYWKGKSYIMLSDLAEKSGKSIKQIKEDIHFLTDRKLLPGAQVDQQETVLMLTDEAISQYEAARESQRIREAEEAERRRQEEELQKQKDAKWANASEEEREMFAFLEDAEDSLRNVQAYQVSIESREVRDKLGRLELVLTRIFVCVKEHPEKLRLTRRLMDYYIPSILRLLSVYEDMEEQPIQGENIQKTMSEIEASMDTMNEALERMFDELFEADAVDVSADIQVLKTMLAQDGWTDAGFSNMKDDAILQ
ncbi:MAG: 5-bromo-4-chloroindolyl phosphate hydrolysis family protein [Eubacterium sp.]|nr:5-bromo-4-chloroindolyl phosphate hydrolysis family protein [Eubacterium sp.]